MQDENTVDETVWNPWNVLECPESYKFALVVLNQPILFHHEQLLPLWEKAQVTVTVDGGTNQWMKYLGDRAGSVLSGQCKKYLPTLVTGDMDSILPDLLDKLKLLGANIIHTPDKMETDYTKALHQLKQYIVENNQKLDGVHVLAETSGRLDHIVSNINTLYKSHDILDHISVFQIAGDSLTWLLNPGTHRIIIPDNILESESWCALIPFGDSNSCVTTAGLKWNLNQTRLRFGELLSTSNTYNGEPQVTVKTNVSLIWTMGIEQFSRISN